MRGHGYCPLEAEGTLDIKYRVSEAVRLIVTKGKSCRKEGIEVQADMLSTMTEGLGGGL